MTVPSRITFSEPLPSKLPNANQAMAAAATTRKISKAILTLRNLTLRTSARAALVISPASIQALPLTSRLIPRAVTRMERHMRTSCMKYEPALTQSKAQIAQSVRTPKTMAAGICMRCSSLNLLRRRQSWNKMKIKCISIVYWPTVPIVKEPILKDPANDTTYGGHEIGAVPRSDLIERATPMATRTRPSVPVP